MSKMLSIEIGRSTIKIVEMDYQSKKPKVYQCLELDTPEGAVKDGYINPNAHESLKNLLKDTLKQNKIRTKRVLFTVFSGKIITREVVIPGVKEHQIKALVESNITEYFPIELDDYKIAHMYISTLREGENSGKHKVLVIAAEQALLAGYEKLAEAVGLNIVDIDYAGNSAYQAIKNNAGAEAIMAIRVEEENALVTIVKKGIMVMQRTVNYNIGRQEEDEPVDQATAMRVLVGTVQRVIDFYISNNEDSRIEQIYLMGEGSRDHAVMKMINEQTQLPTRILENVRGTVTTFRAENLYSNVYAIAIGAGISSVGFDAEKEKERHETNYVSASVLMLVFVIVALAAILSISLIPYNMEITEQKNLQKRQEQLAPAQVVYDQYNGMTELKKRVDYGNALTAHSNDGILDFLTELEAKLPTDVEVTEFASDDMQCVITMRVTDKETAAGVIKKFREFETLKTVVVESIIEEDVDADAVEGAFEDKETTINFTITADYIIEEIIDPAVQAAAEAAATTTETAQ